MVLILNLILNTYYVIKYVTDINGQKKNSRKRVVLKYRSIYRCCNHFHKQYRYEKIYSIPTLMYMYTNLFNKLYLIIYMYIK